MANPKEAKLFDLVLKALKESVVPEIREIDINQIDVQDFYRDVEAIFVDQFVRGCTPWPSDESERNAREAMADYHNNNPKAAGIVAKELACLYLEKKTGEKPFCM